MRSCATLNKRVHRDSIFLLSAQKNSLGGRFHYIKSSSATPTIQVETNDKTFSLKQGGSEEVNSTMRWWAGRGNFGSGPLL